ncbi:MAG: hypothetical protein ACE5H8_06885 [Alphaproteobacteria bacterium]
MAELDPAERLIVWAFRRWVLGLLENKGGYWSCVWNEFARQFGARDGKEALSSFATLIKGLQCYARRTIHHHHPCCPCLGADEVSLICFVAACQNRRPQLARSLAEWMVHPDGAGELLEAGIRLAQAMRRHALNLPERTAVIFETEAARPKTTQVTVH